MKRFAYYITCCSLVALFSCTHDDVYEVLTPVGDGRITIQSTLDDMAITRAAEGEVDDTNPERTITHIDVFAIDKDGNVAYYERNTTGNNNGAAEDGAGTLKLQVARRAKKADDSFYFAQGESYRFILVANATASSEYMATLTTLADLENAVQDDSFETSFVGGGSTNDGETGSGTDSTTGGATEGTPTMSRQTLLHLTGTQQGENPDVETPQVFLMDAVATDNNGNQEWVVNPASGSVDNLDLEAEFKRAASKIVVNITQGEDVEFRTKLGTESTQYDFYKLPASTFVLPNESKLVNIQLINTAPQQNNTETFVWTHTDASNETPRPQNSIKVIGYAYSHSWSDVDLTNETSLILNIPMMWNKDDSDDHSKEEEAPRSWYKVPLSQGKKFERNKCYIVNVTINAVGASTRSTAIELRDIEYVTLDWQDVDINVGDSSESPAYLTLNTDLVEIYNANFDDTSLSFSSSSAITSVTLKDVYSHNIGTDTFVSATDNYDAYYLNKYNQKTSLNADIRNTISATAEENVLNGAISILSPIVPATQAEIDAQIAALPKPPVPTLSEPTYEKEILSEPTFVAEPKPNNYIQTTTTYSEWETSGGNEKTRTRTNTQTERRYEYKDGKYTFQLRSRTCTETQERKGKDWGASTHTDWSDWSDWSADETTQNAWDTAWENYQTYLTDKAAYDAQQADHDYQAYLTDKAAYDAAWATYNAQLADYNERADAIRAAAGGKETHYNTIRYLEFEVTNEQGLTATFRVMQYPTIYITNAVGWYSYRDDFKTNSSHATTYHIMGDKVDGIQYSYGTYIKSIGDGGSRRFWRSKVSETPDPSHQGTSKWNYYYWNSSGSISKNEGTSNENTRMYNIKVTSTSDKYTIGVPRRVNITSNINYDGTNVSVTYDTTEDSEANSKLVSPSFMTASRLGVVTTDYIYYSSDSGTTERETEMYNLFSYHCSNYVEVKKVIVDGVEKKVVYDDWRLPTAAEIGIIISLQPTSSADNSADKAIDYLLNAGYYYSASGPVKNNNSATSISVRCVRDAVDEPKPKNLTE